MLTFPHPGRDLHVQRLRAGQNATLFVDFMGRKLNLLLAAVESFFQKQGQTGVNVFPPALHVLAKTAKAPTAESTGAATKNLLKEVAELAGVRLGIAATAEA